ncbi:hypothetical protein [Pseudonocardia spinosispora]|uniref:hypothetical protein n=1 Tax=Pseudonocardia spinosispora TaxID=103441 RepID=UPI00042982D3|nr:hypothetical protein [Pseudonocardia spinosispora]
MGTSVSVAKAVAPTRDRHEQVIAEALRWCAARGVPADADVFALICAGAESEGVGTGAPFVWTRVGVRALLSDGIASWCALAGVRDCSVEVVPSVWQWFDFLHDTGRFDPRSDPLWELRKPLICYGGLDFGGRPRPVDDPSPIPCECQLPYRETVGYLTALLNEGVLVPDILFPPGREGALALFDTPLPTQRRGKAPPRRAPGRGGTRPGAGGRGGPRGRR